MNKDRTFCVNLECIKSKTCDRYFYNHKWEDDDCISVSLFNKNLEEMCDFETKK